MAPHPSPLPKWGEGATTTSVEKYLYLCKGLFRKAFFGPSMGGLGGFVSRSLYYTEAGIPSAHAIFGLIAKIYFCGQVSLRLFSVANGPDAAVVAQGQSTYVGNSLGIIKGRGAAIRQIRLFTLAGPMPVSCAIRENSAQP